MSFPTKTFSVSWEQFHQDARALAWRILEQEKQRKWEVVVSITRGGLVPTAVICRELEIRVVETICVASYHSYTTQGEMVVLKGIRNDLLENGGKDILVIDDLTDTGRTVAIIRELLPAAHFATVYAKPKGRSFVDTFITEVSQDTWIYFPWDMGFTYQEPLAGSSRTAG